MMDSFYTMEIMINVYAVPIHKVNISSLAIFKTLIVPIFHWSLLFLRISVLIILTFCVVLIYYWAIDKLVSLLDLMLLFWALYDKSFDVEEEQ